MEEKKFDKQSMIGFLLIGAILLFMLWQNQPSPEELAAEKAKQEQIDAEKRAVTPTATKNTELADATLPQDSAAMEQYKATLGSFAYSASLPSATDNITELENDVLALKISNKGGFIVEARLKQFKSYDSLPVYLIKDGNTRFNLNFATTDNRTLNSENMYFEPSLTEEGENQVLSMKLKVAANEYLEYLNSYRYALSGEFSLRTDVLNDIRIPSDWGLEIGVLSEMNRNYANNRICQVDIADKYDHKHQDLSEADASKGLSKNCRKDA